MQHNMLQLNIIRSAITWGRERNIQSRTTQSIIFSPGHYTKSFNNSKSYQEPAVYMQDNDRAKTAVLRQRTCTYRSVSQGQVKTKQQGMSCGMTAAQKPCAPPNKAGLPAASASSHITLQLHRHRFTHSTWTTLIHWSKQGRKKKTKQNRPPRPKAWARVRKAKETRESFRVTGGTLNCEWPRARLNQGDAAFTCSS